MGTFIFLLVTIESMLFLAMQVRVMAACMESQIDRQEHTASAQSRGREGTGGINQPTIRCLWDLDNLLQGWEKKYEICASALGSYLFCDFFLFKTNSNDVGESK